MSETLTADKPLGGQDMMDRFVALRPAPPHNEPAPRAGQELTKRPVFALRNVGEGAVEHNIALNSDSFNKNTNERTWQWEVRWSAVNWERINRAWVEGRAWNYADAEYLEHLRRQGEPTPTANELDELRQTQKPVKVQARPILAIGSGPSLERALPLLPQWEGDIMCSTSQASSLVKAGRAPTYIVCLDHESYPGEILIPGDWDQYPETSLVIHPGVNPDMFEYWEAIGGRMYLFRKLQEQPPFYQVEQRLMYSPDNFNEFHHREYKVSIPGHYTVGGPAWACKTLTDFPDFVENHLFYGPRGKGPNITSTLPSMGSTGAAIIQLAHEMGNHPIFLVGLDFSSSRFARDRWVNGEWRHETAADTAHIHMANDRQKITPENLYDKDGQVRPPVQNDLVQADNGCWTPIIQLYYKRNVVNAWRLNQAALVQTCPPGQTAFDEPPHMPIEEVVERQGRMPDGFLFGKRKILDITDSYHARHNVYVMQFANNGINYVEIPQPYDPLRALHAHMKRIQTDVASGQAPENLPAILEKQTLHDAWRVARKNGHQWEHPQGKKVTLKMILEGDPVKDANGKLIDTIAMKYTPPPQPAPRPSAQAVAVAKAAAKSMLDLVRELLGEDAADRIDKHVQKKGLTVKPPEPVKAADG